MFTCRRRARRRSPSRLRPEPSEVAAHNERNGCARIRCMGMLKVGDTAPDFEVSDHSGQRVRLSSLKGKPVVIWFYPKADTPG